MSGAAIQISRGALLALSAGASSLYLYVNGVHPSGLLTKDLGRFVSGFGLDGLTPQQHQQQMQQGWNNDGVPSYLIPLTEQLNQLSGEVARLRIQGQYAGAYFAGQGWSWTSIITVGGAGCLILYMKGYSFADFMYVTKKALSVAVEALEQGIENLGSALETAKRELSYKIGLVDEKLDDTKKSLEDKITQEVGDVKNSLNVMGHDMKGLSAQQDRVHTMVENIETQIDNIQHKMLNANDQLHTANRGIYLLCNVVANSMTTTKGGSNNNNNDTSSRSLYEELLAFTSSYMPSFSRTNSFPQPNQQQQQQQQLASDGGLKLLVAAKTENNASSRSLPLAFEDMFNKVDTNQE